MYAADFAAGMAGAWLYARGVTIRGWMVAAAVARGAGVLWASGGRRRATPPGSGARQSLWLAVATPAAFGALGRCTAGPGAAGWADNPLARWLGKVSFGVFLFHFMVMLFCLNTLGFRRGRPGLRDPARRWASRARWRPGTRPGGWSRQPARRRVRQAQLTYAAR